MKTWLAFMGVKQLQVNPDFDREIDQWVFVGQLFRAINLSPVGDYDFDGIDSVEYQVLSSWKEECNP